MKAETLRILQELRSHARADASAYRRSFLLMFLTLIFDLGRPYLLKDALDHMAEGRLAGLRQVSLLFLLFVLLDYVCRCGFNHLLSLAFLRTIARIRRHVFDHVLALRMDYFEREPVGKLLTRTISDSESLAETLRSGIATIVVDLLTIAGLLVIMFTLDWSTSPVILLSIPWVLIAVRWAGSAMKAKYLEIRKLLASANGAMAEGLNGVEVLQVFQREQSSYRNFREINSSYGQATILNNVYDAALYAFVDWIAVLATAGVVAWGHAELLGPVNIPSLIVLINLVDRIYVPIRDMSGKFTLIQQAQAALQRIFEMLHQTEPTPSGPKRLDSSAIEVAFQQVGYRYQQEGPTVLAGVDFLLRPGQVVALVGRTGSGKSTVIRLLTKARDGFSGRILVNGIPLQELDTHDLRRHIAVVHQDFHLFPGSLRDNIRLFSPAMADQAIWQVLDLLRARPLVESLEGGLDHPLREEGANLSLGQRQMVVFARALAHGAPLLVMDEATASIDSQTEGWIRQALHQIFLHKTVLVIAHRLSTIQEADIILVMDRGSIVERGTHGELMARSGLYAQLARSIEEEYSHGSATV